MTERNLTDQDAQSSREQWFRYLDVVESIRGELHRYCRRLTRTIWDAEDLLQDALLKGFAMMARGDLHGPQSPVRNSKAYLFRVATNQWIDQQRKMQREILHASIEAESMTEVADVRPAMEKALHLASPQEFAALVLKDGYDFTLEEIADFIGTSIGTVKSALSRGRRKMSNPPVSSPVDPEHREMAEQFADAINRHDLDGLMQLMADSMSIVVCNVGGGRGRSSIWTEKSVQGVTARYAEYEGAAVVLLLDRSGATRDVVRLEVSGGEVTRLTDYCYAPETLSAVARGLQIEIATTGYHQPETVLEGMIDTTTLPWQSV